MKFYNSNKSININDIYINWFIPKNEFYSVVLWIKPLSYRWLWNFTIDDVKIKNTLLFLDKHNLKYKIIKQSKKYILIYWYIDKIIDEFADSYRIKLNFEIICWKLLWYPKCCINKWNWYIWDSVTDAKNKTNNYLFYLNTIFHYWWRWNITSIIWDENNIINEWLSFINHQPCSYDCMASLKIWLKLEKFLKKYDKNYLDILYQKTQKNYIYFSPLNWLSFDFEFKWKQKIKIFEWILEDTELENFFKEEYFLIFNKKSFKITDNKGCIIKKYKLNWVPFLLNFK